MRKFKLKKESVMLYEITTKEDFEKITNGQYPYVVIGNDGNKRAFGICPACDNPIQIVGLYKRILDNKTRAYGKHYNRDAAIAKHDEYTYKFCPYAAHTYNSNKFEKKTKMTDVEIKIYNTLRDNFDSVVYMVEDISGLYISQKTAKEMLKQYVTNECHMYYGSTYYNIPWMLLYTYTLPAIPVFGKIVRKNSFLYTAFSQLPNVKMEKFDAMPSYYKVCNQEGHFIDYMFSVNQHRRRLDTENDKIIEEMTLTISSKNNISDTNPVGNVKISNNKLYITENLFPDFVKSQKINNNRSNTLLKIAKESMPGIEKTPEG